MDLWEFTKDLLYLETESEEQIAAVHIRRGLRGTDRVILYSHGNAEDLGQRLIPGRCEDMNDPKPPVFDVCVVPWVFPCFGQLQKRHPEEQIEETDLDMIIEGKAIRFHQPSSLAASGSPGTTWI